MELGERKKMNRIAETLPELVSEIRRFLATAGKDDIAAQFGDLFISRWTFDPDDDAGYIFLGGQRPLNFVEQNVIGTRHGECIVVEACEGMVVLDTDNFNRVTGVEFLNRKDIKQKLENHPTTPPTPR